MPKGTIDNAQRCSGLSQFEALLASRTLRSGMRLHIRQCTRQPFKQRLTQSKYQECHSSKRCFRTFALAQLWAMNMLLFTWRARHSHVPPLPPGICVVRVPPVPDSPPGKSPSSALPTTPPSSWLLAASHHLPSLDHSFLTQCCVCLAVSLGTSLRFLYYFY